MAAKGKPKESSTSYSRNFNKDHIKRKGRHSKKKHSLIKTSKNYKKAYNSQGR